MKTTDIKYALAAGLFATALTAAAQDTYSGYFLDNYTYRYQMNPAMGNRSNFVSMPVLGNMNIGMNGNIGLTSIVYNRDGKTVLFTNPGVGVAEAMDAFKNVNRIGVNTKINFLSGGWKAWGGYNTVSINGRVNAGFHVPKSLFSLVKEGIGNKTYNIEDVRAQALGYGEIMLGHSRDIKQVPGLRVGANLKFLIGIASAQVNMKEAYLDLGTDAWRARTDGDIKVNLGKFQYETDVTDEGHRYVSGANMDGNGSVGPNGFGIAFDLGATYEWKDFTFSLAFNDLGFISFSKTRLASTNGPRDFNSDAFIFSPDDNADNSFDNEWDKMRDGLEKLYQLDDMGETGANTRGIGAVMNVGVDYKLPYYRRLHFGLLNHTVINGPYSSTEFRISANVCPVDIFSAGINLVAGTYGVGFGWIANLNLKKGFNMFIGMDRTPGKFAKQGVPLNSNMQFNFGIDFPF